MSTKQIAHIRAQTIEKLGLESAESPTQVSALRTMFSRSGLAKKSLALLQLPPRLILKRLRLRRHDILPVEDRARPKKGLVSCPLHLCNLSEELKAGSK